MRPRWLVVSLLFACRAVDESGSRPPFDTGAPPEPPDDSGVPTGGDTARESGETADTADTSDTSDEVDPLLPTLSVAAPTLLPVPTAAGLPVVTGFTVNAQVDPQGLPCAWLIQYGPTEAYGTNPPSRALPGRLDAVLVEDWDEGTSPFRSGIGGGQLTWIDSGGADGGPFVRYTDDQGAGDDANHLDGIGVIHLGLYAYIGSWDPGTLPPLYLGGGWPDLRGAVVSLDLRGVGWTPEGTVIGSWIQARRGTTPTGAVPTDPRYPNWAFTGDPQTDHLASGRWEHAEWSLPSRTDAWTFAGTNGGRLTYDYGELDAELSAVDVDFFPVQVLGVDQAHEPSGSIDYDHLTLRYRQHSVLAASNGATLESAPTGDADRLTDGVRNGAEHEWVSDELPRGDQVFEWSLAQEVTAYRVLIHNSVDGPSADVTVEGRSAYTGDWQPLLDGTLPEPSPDGPNTLFLVADRWELVDGAQTWLPLAADPSDRVRVTVHSGASPERWGLGEVEVFGTGAREATDDSPYALSADVLVPSGTWHYRVGAVSDAGRTWGTDNTVVVP